MTDRQRRPGFTLVELLVVIGVIGTLVALLLPAVQSARETTRRTSCVDRLRQLGLATQNYVAAQGVFPSGSLAQPTPGVPSAAWTFYRWSALATLTPYLENAAVRDALDFDQPLYDAGAGFQVPADNRAGVRLVLSEFLCPSDEGLRLVDRFGPTNYAVCTGSGGGDPQRENDDGSPLDTDGIFGVNSRTRPGQVSDGLSKTVLASESPLGVANTSAPRDVQREYQFAFGSPLAEGTCSSSTSWNYTDPRGFSWANGEYRCALYNHKWSPNAAEADCLGVSNNFLRPDLRFTPFGWRSARSLHPGGVNIALADGSVRFVDESVELAAWRAGATRAGADGRDL